MLHLSGFILGVDSGLKILCVLFPVETQKQNGLLLFLPRSWNQYQSEKQAEGAILKTQRSPKDTEAKATSVALQKFVLALVYGARAIFTLSMVLSQCRVVLGNPLNSNIETILAGVQHAMHIKPQITLQ